MTMHPRLYQRVPQPLQIAALLLVSIGIEI